MNELAKGKTMTLKEVAEVTGAAYSTVAAYAQKAGWTQNGKTTRLNEAQVTVILEALKTPKPSGAKSNLLIEMEGVETAQSLDFQLALIERRAHELWKRKALEQEGRAVRAEQQLQTAQSLLTARETGLEAIQRIAEAGGLVMSDRDDILALYGRKL
jgi:transcriptional regulator with XRE-family HTH domain